MSYPPRLEIRVDFSGPEPEVDLFREFGHRPVFTQAEGGAAVEFPLEVDGDRSSLWINDEDQGLWFMNWSGGQEVFSVGRGVPPTVPDRSKVPTRVSVLS